MRAAREVSGLQGHSEGVATDAAVLAAIPSNSPAEVLSAARLRFLPRLVRHAPPVLLAMLASGDPANRGHWKGALAADLDWLAEHSELRFSSGPEERVAQACESAAADPKAWRPRREKPCMS